MAQVFLFISPHFPETYYRFVRALKERGFITLGIGSAAYYEIPSELKNCIDEYYALQDMEDIENEKIAVEYFINKYGHIDWLESNNDFWLERDAELRELYNIPNGPRPKELALARHKSMMMPIFESAGISIAPWTLVNTLDNLKKFASKVGYPIFIKPDVGVGAVDNHKIYSEEELEEFFNNKNEQEVYIAEQYVPGDLCSFDGISNSKGEVIFSTTHEFNIGISEIVADQTKDLFYYTNLDDDPKLVEAGTKAVKAFNAKNRFFHCEFFRLTSSVKGLGKKGDYVALEINLRPAGGYTPDLINYANSCSCYDIYADSIAYDENREDMSKTKYFAACASRRDSNEYVYSDEDLRYKYYFHLHFSGEYPEVYRGDMGDRFFMAKFVDIKEVMDFKDYVTKKK
ncbi:MAG: ATP-grasp domain-containing protein [Coprobacillus sp.]|nr:ATP-grasp domain-containing protein [Coprobacillus sp.]